MRAAARERPAAAQAASPGLWTMALATLFWVVVLAVIALTYSGFISETGLAGAALIGSLASPPLG